MKYEKNEKNERDNKMPENNIFESAYWIVQQIALDNKLHADSVDYDEYTLCRLILDHDVFQSI